MENTPPAVEPEVPTKGTVKVVDRSSPFVDSVYDVIEEDVDHVVVLIKVGLERFFHIFHKSQVASTATLPIVTEIK